MESTEEMNCQAYVTEDDTFARMTSMEEEETPQEMAGDPSLPNLAHGLSFQLRINLPDDKQVAVDIVSGGTGSGRRHYWVYGKKHCWDTEECAGQLANRYNSVLTSGSTSWVRKVDRAQFIILNGSTAFDWDLFAEMVRRPNEKHACPKCHGSWVTRPDVQVIVLATESPFDSFVKTHSHQERPMLHAEDVSFITGHFNIHSLDGDVLQDLADYTSVKTWPNSIFNERVTRIIKCAIKPFYVNGHNIIDNLNDVGKTLHDVKDMYAERKSLHYTQPGFRKEFLGFLAMLNISLPGFGVLKARDVAAALNLEYSQQTKSQQFVPGGLHRLFVKEQPISVKKNIRKIIQYDDLFNAKPPLDGLNEIWESADIVLSTDCIQEMNIYEVCRYTVAHCRTMVVLLDCLYKKEGCSTFDDCMAVHCGEGKAYPMDILVMFYKSVFQVVTEFRNSQRH